MDEKTEELRDIFLDTTGGDTVTERQEEGHGSLASDPDVEGRLAELVGRMRERYEFASDLADEDLVRLVRLYFDGTDDDAIADALGVPPDAVFTARMDLHLVRESDREAPFDLSRLRSLYVDDVPLDERAAELDAEEETVARYSEVVAADARSTRANDRFRDEFAELLAEQDLKGGHTEDAREDGLREAAEDIETNVSF
ncbi:conditioned medium-induced protein 4 [Halobaculum magnesiiphilum]|uniref:Conditioned medium-induced protein 4 n=1 Tax=Halobaculum magnesiiphilum TaxID=1017351 RepID=A0A8T8W9X0_9EURY|nr:conditioned medium-induced protein 4 [Halobaculum magnesiiphilum]QZP36635.1 conditioned medium-induced protein 4 [Halobaculum magnesiiphilum]